MQALRYVMRARYSMHWAAGQFLSLNRRTLCAHIRKMVFYDWSVIIPAAATAVPKKEEGSEVRVSHLGDELDHAQHGDARQRVLKQWRLHSAMQTHCIRIV